MPVVNWIGKSAVVRHHKEVPFRLIEPVAELSCDAPVQKPAREQGLNTDAELQKPTREQGLMNSVQESSAILIFPSSYYNRQTA